MKAWIGKSLIAIGMIHTVFGFVFMRTTLGVLVSEGLVNTVNGEPPREAVFWFLYTGFLLLILGGVIDWLERRQQALPGFLPWAFLVLTVVGAVIMPVSGIWLFVVPLVGLFLRR